MHQPTDPITSWWLFCQIYRRHLQRSSRFSLRQVNHYFWLLAIVASAYISLPAWSSEIEADPTTNSIVTAESNVLTITGGTTVGNYLFHSFREFSVPTGGIAFFNQPLTVQTILARVTGNSISTINGIIQANGTTNLFLLNPHGIVFGANARLNIGGSFLATTANSFQFADGSEFSATNPTPPPMLTINVPLGLQFGVNPGRIVQQSPWFAVQPGQTLGLLGGDVVLSGGNLIALGGRVELGSVQEPGQVLLMPTSPGFTLSYPQLTTFGEIQLSGGAQINTSGSPSGAIQIQGRSLQLQENARILSTNLGSQAGGALTINASDAIEIIGTGNYELALQQIATGQLSAANALNIIATIAASSGAVGGIVINTQHLRLQNGAYITSVANSSEQPGNLTVNAANIDLNQGLISSLTLFGSQGNSGAITVNTDRLTMQDNSFISTATLGTGSSGKLVVRATDSVNLVGDQTILLPIQNANRITTSISTNGLLGGQAGDLELTTRRLVVIDGAQIVADSISQANAGNVRVRAADAIFLSGSVPDRVFPTSISARGFGNGGNLSIQTGSLRIEAGAGVSVLSQGTGMGGNLEITADSIQLNDRAFLEAASLLGTGGNLQLQVRDLLLMRHNARISSSAGLLGGTGKGGNITIAAKFIVAPALENSDITANAFGGQGGNIQIRTQGLFGIQFRPQLTPLSDITASSQFGVQGVVSITNPNLDPSQNRVQLSTNFLEATNLLDQRCAARGRANSFVISGRGGLPPTPQEVVNTPAGWSDESSVSRLQPTIAPLEPHGNLRESMSQGKSPPPALAEATRSAATNPEPLIEATHWVTAADGTIVLVANPDDQMMVNQFSRGCSPSLSPNL